MQEDDKKEKILTQLEIENILDETINLSIISKLLNLNLSTGVYTLIDQNTNQNINFTVKQDGEKCILKLGQYLNTKIPNIKNIKNNNFFIGVFILFFGIVIINYEKIW